MTEEEISKEIFNVSYLKGNFLLRSGLQSSFYFDKYQFETEPKLLKSLVNLLNELIPTETELLGGIELGGIPLSTALSLEMGLPQILVRKERKNYGTRKIAEGINVSNKNICLIEDIISTGGQVIKSVNELRKSGALVKTVVYVISIGKESKCLLKENGLIPIPLFEMEDILKFDI